MMPKMRQSDSDSWYENSVKKKALCWAVLTKRLIIQWQALLSDLSDTKFRYWTSSNSSLILVLT